MRATRRFALAAVAVLGALPAGAALAQPAPAFKYAEPEEAKKVEWKAQLRAGLNVTGGNAQLLQFSGGGTVSRNDGKNKLQLNADGAYAETTTLADANGNGTLDPGEEQKKPTVNNWLITFRYDRFFSKNNKGYLLASAGGNAIAGRELAAGAQLGYSRQLFKNDVHELLLEAGLDYSHERYVQPAMGGGLDPLNIFSLRAFLGNNMSFSKDTALNIGVEYLGNLLPEVGYKILQPVNGVIQKGDATFFEDSRVNAKASLSTKLTAWMSVGVNFTVRFDNVPALRPGYKVAAEKLDTLADVSLLVNLL